MLSLLYNVLSLYEYFIRLHKLFKYKCCLDFKFHAVKRLKLDAREKKISLGISLPGSCAISWVTKRTKVAHLYMNRDRDSISYAHVQKHYNCKIVSKEYRNRVLPLKKKWACDMNWLHWYNANWKNRSLCILININVFHNVV